MSYNNEMDAVADAVERAETYELIVEVVTSALSFVQEGFSIQDACEMALRDWDL